MSKEGDSVIRPGDIPVKAERYKTVLSPVASDLAASYLGDVFDEKLAKAGKPPDPLEMEVTPPRRLGFIDLAAFNRRIRATRRNLNRLLKKITEG